MIVDAFVFQWGQIKTHQLHLSVFINNTDPKLVFVYCFPPMTGQKLRQHLSFYIYTWNCFRRYTDAETGAVH